MALVPGTRLGPYEIVAPLGAGGMGEVYRARDTRLGREVAIKALSGAFAGDLERLARFEREARALAALNHPNIAAIYGLEEVPSTPSTGSGRGGLCLVLELVEGETLATRLARGALPVGEAIGVCSQLASAIEAAHERGIVHRDLKPANIMLTLSSVVKVLDFGLAKGGSMEFPAGGASKSPAISDSSQSPTRAVRPDETTEGMILGTAAYMSPDQARGLPVDRRTDIWSFGCILFECLTGRAAFAGATASDLIARVLEREPEWQSLPAGVPPRVRDLLRRCLRKNVDERTSEIRDARSELLSTAGGGEAPAATGEQSIAVLPFTHTQGADDEYFADGITEEIMNALAQLEGLRVAARTSSFAFKGRLEDLRQIGEKLSVATVLEGSVRRSGSRLRITAQLVNAADGYQLWSERYDRELTDVFEVQDEIASAIAAKLKLTLAGGKERVVARRGTTSLEAYDLFLKGRALQNRRGGFIRQAIRCFEQALALDPDYVEVLSWMADSYRLLATYGMAPPGETEPKAKAAALAALALDPGAAEAHATLADIEAQYDRDLDAATRSWQRALELDPRHSRARCERALWNFGVGSFGAERTLSEVEKALQDDPLNAWSLAMHAFMLGMIGRHDEGIARAKQALGIDPDSFFARVCLVQLHAWSGDHRRAIELGHALLAPSGRHPWALAALAMPYALSGNLAAALAIHDELEARARFEFVPPFWLAAAAASAGLIDEAVRLAARAVDERDPMALLARVMPEWGPIQDRPEFPGMIAKMGIFSTQQPAAG